MTIEIRELDYTNFSEVRDFLIGHEYTWRDSDPSTFQPKSEEKRDESATKFMERKESDPEREGGIIAYDGSRMIGSHRLEVWNIDHEKACHIHGLWVDPEYRGRGIALEMKKLGEKWAMEHGCKIMDSNVKVSNENMITLNEKMGYTVARFNYRKRLDCK
jgi:RimJ/RimL family protein N-acetyltransferase